MTSASITPAYLSKTFLSCSLVVPSAMLPINSFWEGFRGPLDSLFSTLMGQKVIYYGELTTVWVKLDLWYKSLEGPGQQFREQIFFISTQKHKRVFRTLWNYEIINTKFFIEKNFILCGRHVIRKAIWQISKLEIWNQLSLPCVAVSVLLVLKKNGERFREYSKIRQFDT